MKYFSALSGGVASAVAHARAIERYGEVEPVFSDVRWEDGDLYRFLDDLQEYWTQEIRIFRDGRRPLELADEKKLIFNSFIAPCSFELKVKPFLEYLETIEKPATVFVGIQWHEDHRNDKVKAIYESVEGVTVDFPLQWKPTLWEKPITIVEGWGIEPPRLYKHGFPHNNCGGRCVRQGVTEWRRLLYEFPERFQEVKEWENRARSHDDARSNRSINKRRETIDGEIVSFPFPLEEIEKMEEEEMDDYGGEDIFSCMCGY